MTLIFIANVGLRDLSHAGLPLASPRAEGEALLARWPEGETDLALPLLEPTLTYLRCRGQFPERIVLCASDQPESAGEHRQSDTLPAAKLAQRLLCRRFRLPDQSVVVLAATDRNPALYDEMYAFFRWALAEHKAFRGADACLVFPVGGTPAANTGLLWAAAERFGAACRVLYLRQGTTMPVFLDAGRQLHLAFLRRSLLDQLRRRQFAAAQANLESMGYGPGTYPYVLADYCLRRLNFDFRGAAAAALGPTFAAATPARRATLDAAAREADTLAGGAEETILLVELARNTRHAYESGAYLDCLSRLVRLEECAARLLVARRLPPLNFDSDTPAARERRLRQLEAFPDLLAYLSGITVAGEPLARERANTVVLLHLLDYLLAERPQRPPEWGLSPEERDRLGEARRILGGLASLNRQRNRATHAFGGASREDIDGLYAQAAGEPRDILGDLDRLVGLVTGASCGSWLVDGLAEEIAAALARSS